MTSMRGERGKPLDALLAKLLRLPEGARLTREEAEDLVDWLAERLEDSLPGEVQVERETLSHEHGDMDVTLRSRSTFGGALSLAWLARLFITVLGDDTVSVNARVFLFCNNRRVLAPPRGDYLYMELWPGDGVAATWSEPRWSPDEFDEWRDMETLDDPPPAES